MTLMDTQTLLTHIITFHIEKPRSSGRRDPQNGPCGISTWKTNSRRKISAINLAIVDQSANNYCYNLSF